MSVRPQIPAIEGVQDPRVVPILDAMKSIIEMVTGRTPNRTQIKPLGPNATLGGVITKLNEIIARLQG